MIPRLIALALLAVVVLIAAGPLRPLYKRVEAWTWQQDERTWVAHGSILLMVGFSTAVLIGWFGLGFTGWGMGWYARREKVFTGEPMTTDNWMDFLAPQLGGLLGFALGLVVR